MTERRRPLLGGESRCLTETGEYRPPSDLMTVVLIACLLLVVFDAYFLYIAKKHVDAGRGDPVPGSMLMLGLSVALHVAGWCIFLVRYQKCEAMHGFGLYVVFAVLSFVVGLALRLKEHDLKAASTARPAP